MPLDRRAWMHRLLGLTAAGAVGGPLRACGGATARRRRGPVVLYSGWQTINIGDLGHTLGTLRLFEQHLPQVPVVWWAASLNDEVRRLHMRRFPGVPIVEGAVDDRGEPDNPALRATLAEARLLVANSKPGTSPPVMRAAARFEIPWGCYGHSYDANTFTDRPELVDAYSRAAFVFLRDSLSLDTVRRAGIHGPHIAWGPDGCFGIDVRDDARAEAWLAAHDVRPDEYLTIMLRTNTPKHPTKDDPLNPQRPTAEQVRDDERRAAKLREVIVAWVRETGHRVILAPEVDKEIPHNRRLLWEPLPGDVRGAVVPRETFWLPDEAASLFARARVVVCHEPHSCIIALAMGTPSLHPSSLVHGPKREMFRDIGLGEWLLDLDAQPAADVIRAVRAIDADPASARAQVAKAMRFVAARQAETMKFLGELLDA